MTGDAAPRPVGPAGSTAREGSRSPLRLLVPTVLVAALLAGCASIWSGPPSELFEDGEEATEEDGTVTVVVQNYNVQEMGIHVLAGGSDERLGLVGSQQRATFQVPKTMVGSRTTLRLVAVPFGTDRAFTSERIHFQRGDQIEWTLQNQLSTSSVRVN